MMSIGLWAQEAVFTHVIDVGTGYVSRVELPVQRRLCPIFVRNVGSPDIHDCFRGLMGSQRTPGIWGVTINISQPNTYISLGSRVNKLLFIQTYIKIIRF